MMNNSIKEITSDLRSAIDISLEKSSEESLLDFLDSYDLDERKSVEKLCERARKNIEKLSSERARIDGMKAFDKSFGSYELIAGIDEVGRGSIAGPVVTCAVVMKPDSRLFYINDSKKLSQEKREELYDKIIADSLAYSFGVVSPKEIDEINILNATKKAMKLAFEGLEKNLNDSLKEGLEKKPDLLLVDAVKLDDISVEKRAIIKGDEKSYTIACASILAKVYRDRMMAKYDEIFSGYDFYKNKGYGTKEHLESVMKYGATSIHRMTFIPDKYL